MTKGKVVLLGLLFALGVLIYTSGVGWILFNGEELLGDADSFMNPALLLMILVLSSAITGLLVFGGSIWFYLHGDKKGALRLLISILVFLLIFVAIILSYKMI